MNASQLADVLRERGATLSKDAESLRVSPSRVLDNELRAAIRCHKTELLALLQLESASKTSTRCKAREFRVLDAYEPARAYAYAACSYRLGRIEQKQRDNLQCYALRV